MGKCPACGEWNSLVETTVLIPGRKTQAAGPKLEPQSLSRIKSVSRSRIKTGLGELDRVLGGGIVPGSVILVAGEPGIGKSTLMLQLVAKVGGLYVSGEESLAQIKLRAQRLGLTKPTKKEAVKVLAATDVVAIGAAIKNQPAPILVVDSIQAIQSDHLTGAAGSVGQVRECALYLLRIAKSKGIPIFFVGHVTKAGAIAGPKILEHMVDTVVYFEGEKFAAARLVRATKNRFGATDEVGVFAMTNKGLVEVANPSKLFLKKRVKKVPGSVVVATIEGTRPVLVEIQALVTPTQLAIPRRVGRGVDRRRLQLICAVLAKRLGLPLGGTDVFVNVAGGIRIDEPAADLGVALAIVSSFKNIALDDKLAVFGELGLLGETRAVAQADKRLKEAKKLGFKTVISPANATSINQAVKKLLR